MKNTKAKVLVIVLIIGLALIIAGFSDAMIIFKGKTVDLNKASISDLDKPALAEGEIDFVYGPFATYEESQKTLGITTSKKNTEFYVVGNFTADDFEDMTAEDFEKNVFWTVFSTSDKDLIKQLDDAAQKWYDYLAADEISDVEVPDVSIRFEGKLASQSDDKKYKQYYEDAIDDLSNVGIEESDFAKCRILTGKFGNSILVIFFIGVALFVIGVVGLILSAKADRKNAGEITDVDDLY